jgi:integrase
MASIRRHPRSPFWIACIRLPDGRRTNRSTGTTDKKEAQRVANKFEDASEEAKVGRFTESRARKTISEIFAIANKDFLPSSNIKDYLESWLQAKQLEVGEKTHRKYAEVVGQFLQFLGAKAHLDMVHLASREITKFRAHLAGRGSAGTVNVALKIIRAALNQAKRENIVDVNEAERVTLVSTTDESVRRPFTRAELSRVLAVANDEWRRIIAFGYYTGQRIGDIADLCWNNLDLEQCEIRFFSNKPGKYRVLPIAKHLMSLLGEMPAGDDPKAPLFPNAYAVRQRNEHSGTLSNQFTRLLVKAGLLEARPHRSTGKGRSAKRELNELCFHSLRHSTTTDLKQTGASNAVAEEVVGHESSEVNRNYTHIDVATLRTAVDRLPNILVDAGR